MAKPAALNHPLKLDLKRFRFLFLCCFFVFQKVLVCVFLLLLCYCYCSAGLFITYIYSLRPRQKLWKDINTFFNGQFGPA